MAGPNSCSRPMQHPDAWDSWQRVGAFHLTLKQSIVWLTLVPLGRRAFSARASMFCREIGLLADDGQLLTTDPVRAPLPCLPVLLAVDSLGK